MAILVAVLPTLVRPTGRPARPSPETSAKPIGATITRAVLRYVMQHAGCAHRSAQRQGYSDDFRHFIVALRTQYEDVALELFATLVEVPLGTLKSWLSPATSHASQPSNSAATSAEAGDKPDATLAQIETVLAAWQGWHGTLVDFAKHVRTNLRVPLGRQLVTRILDHNGVRTVRRRPGRSPDESALRGAFETFFPGAQWVGDGKTVRVVLDNEAFTFNLELQVDAHSGAFVGVSARDNEDSTAVIESFEDGVATTGAAPIAALLDNKPSNHAAEVVAVLDSNDTLSIRATVQRPQNKAHVEGAFGLFSQQVPPIELNTKKSQRSIARELLFIVAMTWARATNHRPRADRGGRTRVELYGESPTDEQIVQARKDLEARCRRQELARATQEARQRPEVRALLDTQFDRLGLFDPQRRVRIAIARYPLDAIVDGIAIFVGKQSAGTLPRDVDARYLLGIVRNVAAKREGECITEAMLELRTQARDRALAALDLERKSVCAASRTDRDVIADCVLCALGGDREMDRIFWLGALAATIGLRGLTSKQRRWLVRVASQHIHATFRVSPRERQDAVRFVTDRIVPLN
ncbi:MAG: hypothetical protein JRH20_25555 [Deltaproteobacteria bacterium]|nr:hypothetical protein [Deltaproteobacteria bacterium]